MSFSRLIVALPLVALALVPTSARAQEHDPTTKVTGGALPAGWELRFDPSRRQPPPQPGDVNFRAMGAGWHLTSGPAALYYRPADKTSGDFSVSATISQAKSMQHEAYGIFVGGHDLQSAEQNYVYMVVHPQGGKYLINHRTSDGRPTSLVAYTETTAVHKENPTSGAASNTLTIKATGGVLHFLINGTEVHSIKASEIPDFTADGVAGLRLNHNLDVHIADFKVDA